MNESGDSLGNEIEVIWVCDAKRGALCRKEDDGRRKWKSRREGEEDGLLEDCLTLQEMISDRKDCREECVLYRLHMPKLEVIWKKKKC